MFIGANHFTLLIVTDLVISIREMIRSKDEIFNYHNRKRIPCTLQ